jgi:hypothetical protein
MIIEAQRNDTMYGWQDALHARAQELMAATRVGPSGSLLNSVPI